MIHAFLPYVLWFMPISSSVRRLSVLFHDLYQMQHLEEMIPKAFDSRQ